jgi:hypothetical protein
MNGHPLFGMSRWGNVDRGASIEPRAAVLSSCLSRKRRDDACPIRGAIRNRRRRSCPTRENHAPNPSRTRRHGWGPGPQEALSSSEHTPQRNLLEDDNLVRVKKVASGTGDLRGTYNRACRGRPEAGRQWRGSCIEAPLLGSVPRFPAPGTGLGVGPDLGMRRGRGLPMLRQLSPATCFGTRPGAAMGHKV